MWGKERIQEFLMKIKENKTFVHGGLFSFFSLLNRGFSFLLLLVLANYIAPSEYGYLSLFNTILMLIGYFVAFSTEGYVSVSFFKGKEEGVKKTISGVLLNSIIISAFLLLLLLVFGESLSILLSLPLNVLYMSIVISVTTIMVNVYLDLFRVQEKIKNYGLVSCSNAVLNFGLSIYLIVILSMGWVGRVFAQMICYSLFGFLAFSFFLKRKMIWEIDFSHYKTMLLWGMPLIPHVATNFIRQGCDRYIIDYYHTIEDVGFFSFAFNLANIIIMIGSGFNQSNAVDIFKILGNKTLSVKEKEQHLIKQKAMLFKVYTLCSLGTILVVSLFVPLWMPQYAPSIPYFIILAFYAYFLCVYLLYTNFLFFYEKTKAIMYVTLGSSIIHFVLSFLLTRYSLYITCLIYCITQMIIVFLIRKESLRTLNCNGIKNLT